MPVCAACGIQCSEDECQADTRGKSETIGGMVEWTQIELVYYCLPCTASRARTLRQLAWIFAGFVILGSIGASIEFYRWLFGR